MKKNFLIAAVALLLFSPAVAKAEIVDIDGKTYQMDRLIERQIAPGTTYLRLQFPEIPLNVNMVIADLNNEYLGVENSVANESAKGVEKIANAVSRLSQEGHKAIAGQNANFWAVSSQAPDGILFSSQTRNASIRNGKMVTECNMSAEIPFGGPVSVTGILGITPDKEVYVDYCRPSVAVRINDGIALYTVNQCNKGVHPNEIGMYNSFYGSSKAFQPIAAELNSSGYYQLDEANDAIEVLLDIAENQEWMGGKFIDFVVKEIREDAGTGTLGQYDLALVGRGNGRTKLARAKVGDKVSLKYSFEFNPSGESIYPLIDTSIGGNLLMMRNGEVLTQCKVADYDSTTYPRSLYGTSSDHKTLYMMVIDKSTDPTYGRSAGLSTWQASQIARHFGCTNMLQCDGGGSAQLYVTDKVVNKTTESTPRAVANCLLLFDNSPADNEIAYLKIDYPEEVIELELGATFTPKILAYNQYGSLLDIIYGDFEITCSEGLGSGSGITFTASSTPQFGTITVTYQGKTVTHKVSVGGAVDGLSDVKVEAQTLKIMPSVVAPGETVRIESVENAKISVFNMLGQKIIDSKPIDSFSAPFSRGLYIVTDKSATAKLLVK